MTSIDTIRRAIRYIEAQGEECGPADHADGSCACGLVKELRASEAQISTLLKALRDMVEYWGYGSHYTREAREEALDRAENLSAAMHAEIEMRGA
jgi:hypothetical protein